MLLMTHLSHKLRLFTLLLLCSVISIVSHAEDEGEEAPVPTAYVELKPSFVVNYQTKDNRLRYIKTSISIRTDVVQKDLIEANMPLVRDALVMFLSSRTAKQVTGTIAREQTRADAALAVNNAMLEETRQTPVKDILFASFVTQ
ncbi:flagellar basal body-associated FliL family protein [Marinomonas sp. IMCC 4694]|uniref:flagellar basal body-associated FliL family protein n=1 Tax=Marinomonas sp. IMCC 4694 TaxID=2605432 RepID=UPI0011E660EF|nr:flagellar basal body-associated FliL family protein [Marinomonas sp. IMCC 4694]TYL46836.1 flagellar basal body protein FliL [Marinomonas sp. IMCC 4694]